MSESTEKNAAEKSPAVGSGQRLTPSGGSGLRWTPAQSEAIHAGGVDLLVSAAAGSGKTAILTERIKRLVVDEEVPIDRFLITTFTNAAAAEMKEKLERKIAEEMKKDLPPKKKAFLQEQMAALPQASIGTFHSFAIDIIRDYFFLTDLEPGFAIGDETRVNILRKESVDEVFEQRFEEGGEWFTEFLRKYSRDRNDENLKENLLEIYKEMRSVPRYMEWAAERTELLRSPSPVDALGLTRMIAEETVKALRRAAELYEKAAEFLSPDDMPNLYGKAMQDAEMLSAMAMRAEEMAAEPAEEEGPAPALLSRIECLLESLRLNRMSASGAEKEAYEPIKKEFGELRKQAKKPIDEVKKTYFSPSPAESDRVLGDLYADTVTFLSLIAETEAAYREKKQRENIIDFDDVMHYAIRILADEGAAAECRSRFSYIFIDEYQDSNYLQEEIVGRIAEGNELFVVGDVKQSIYRFRLAEPDIFRKRYRRYRSGQDERGRKIDLNTNFRSRTTIRNAVNRIFEAAMEDYDEDARLNGDDEAEYRGAPVCLHIIDRSAGPEEEAAGEAGTGDPAETEPLTEPALIADLIREKLGTVYIDRNGNPQTIRPRDIAVLSRGKAEIAQIERYLNNEGIPAYGETDGGYYETVEIQVFLNLLRIISNIRQDVPLISVMSAMFFDFTPAELAQIRIASGRGTSYYEAVRAYAETGTREDLKARIREMLRQIELWREIARTVPLDELIRILLYETGYYDYCSGLPVGHQRVSNLRLLLDRAARFEETSYGGLHGFLDYVEAMKKTSQRVGEAPLAGEGQDVVRVMTVHKSKGLEFPVVILSGAGKKIKSAGVGYSVAMHRSLAVALPQINRQAHWRKKTLLQKAIAAKKTAEGLEEEIRILYVALTRVMDSLIIVGSIADREKEKEETAFGSFLEMITPALTEMAGEDPDGARVIYHEGRVAVSAKATAPGEAAPEATAPLAAAGGEDEPEAAGASTAGDGNSDADAAQAGEDLAAEIDRRLSFIYPYSDRLSVRSKYSVTELNRIRASEDAVPARKVTVSEQASRAPELKTFGGEKGPMSAAEAGTVMHIIMERIAFAKAAEEGLPYIEAAARQMAEQGLLTGEELAAARPENIAAFFKDPVGKRAAAAKRLCREKEFICEKEIGGVPAIVQGVIDCWFEEEDGLVLIDYKNSRLGSDADEAAIVERYRGQLEIYREALEEATGKRVKESYLYLFRARKFVPLQKKMK